MDSTVVGLWSDMFRIEGVSNVLLQSVAVIRTHCQAADLHNHFCGIIHEPIRRIHLILAFALAHFFITAQLQSIYLKPAVVEVLFFCLLAKTGVVCVNYSLRDDILHRLRLYDFY